MKAIIGDDFDARLQGQFLDAKFAISLLPRVRRMNGKDASGASGAHAGRALTVEAGLALHQRGDLAQAEQAYRQVLSDQPGNADALHFLGVLYLQTGQLHAAAELIETSLKHNPQQPLAHLNLGVALQQLSRLQEALSSYDQAIRLNPNFARALNNRGNVLRDLARLEDALDSFERALRVDPDYAAALYNRGNALLELNRYDEAVDGFERLLRIQPDDADALAHRGIALLELKRYAEALASLNQALSLQPELVPALINRGNVLQQLGRTDEGLVSLDQVLRLDPDNIVALCNRGNALLELHRIDEALVSFVRAAQLSPSFQYALFRCATILMRLRQQREAIEYFRGLGAIEPNYPYARGLEFLARSQICEWSDVERRRAELVRDVAQGTTLATPFSFLVASDSAAALLQCARANTRDRHPACSDLLRAAPHRHPRIRLAYVSGDLRNHAVAHLLVGVIERHDRQRFEVNAISLQPPQEGPIGQRVRNAFDRFDSVGAMTDADIAAAIRAMEIDIVIDLAGYTEGNRLGIFARRAAPVQVTFLGYAGTTGAPYMDYLVADEVVVPQGEECWYSEQVVRMPHCYLPNDDRREIAMLPTRAEAGLPDEGMVFCAFTNAYKINPRVFDVWMRLLSAVPGSVLWLRSMGSDARESLQREARQRGVDGARLLFAPHVAAMADHLARLSLADLFLDTVPYGAHSTACDALWAGLPVLTCLGQSFASRVAASTLRAVGLPELVTDGLEAYERVALQLARHPEQLQQLRRRLKQNRATAPLFDTGGFTRQLEAAYRTMHEVALRGEPAAGFSVSALPT
ncbi:MAG: tetratricopeptide repeat protein [Steroidobacteraceae bacterium]